MSSATKDRGAVRGTRPAAGRILVITSGGDGSGLVTALQERGHEVATAGKVPDGTDHELVFVTGTGDEPTPGAAPLTVLVTPPDGTATPRHDGTLALDPGTAVAQTPGLLALARRLRAARRGSPSTVGAEGELVGRSAALRRLASVLSRAASSDATLLIEGQGGSGRTRAAERIHAGSRRADQPLVSARGESVADPEELESLLKQAAGGTLLIEEVDTLPAATQGHLVRYLKDRPGNADPEVRLIATTSARLPEQVARGGFREDLYYRLNVFPIVVPSLRERREDICLLAQHFLACSSIENGWTDAGFTPAAMILLESHPWEGNVAQLRTVVERAHGLAAGGPIDRMHLMGPATGWEPPSERPPGEERRDDEPCEEDIRPLQEEEKELLSRALKATRGNVRRAAQLLKIGRATLYRKIQVYDLRMN